MAMISVAQRRCRFLASLFIAMSCGACIFLGLHEEGFVLRFATSEEVNRRCVVRSLEEATGNAAKPSHDIFYVESKAKRFGPHHTVALVVGFDNASKQIEISSHWFPHNMSPKNEEVLEAELQTFSALIPQCVSSGTVWNVSCTIHDRGTWCPDVVRVPSTQPE